MLGQSASFRRRLGRAAAGAVMASSLVLVGGPSAHAAPAELVCTGGGTITIDKQVDGTWKWLMSGLGSCSQAKLAQARQVTLLGRATTTSLGLCSGDALIAPFAMDVTATYVGVSPTQGQFTSIQTQSWTIPASTFPIVSEFAINDANGGALGVGELETHIFGHCPPDGTPVMQVNWVQSA